MPVMWRRFSKDFGSPSAKDAVHCPISYSNKSNSLVLLVSVFQTTRISNDGGRTTIASLLRRFYERQVASSGSNRDKACVFCFLSRSTEWVDRGDRKSFALTYENFLPIRPVQL